MADGSVVIGVGAGGIGQEIARRFLSEGSPVVIVGQDPDKADRVASQLREGASGIGFDLADPESKGPTLAGGAVHRLVLLKNPGMTGSATTSTALGY